MKGLLLDGVDSPNFNLAGEICSIILRGFVHCLQLELGEMAFNLNFNYVLCDPFVVNSNDILLLKSHYGSLFMMC